jgi:hypothetical protein
MRKKGAESIQGICDIVYGDKKSAITNELPVHQTFLRFCTTKLIICISV